MKSIEDFYEQAAVHIAMLDSFVHDAQLESSVTADHIGYKCDSKEEYEFLRGIFDSNSKYIFQSIISERRISIIRLAKPLLTIIGEIKYLELSDQKPDGSQKNGFDHVEAYPRNISYEALIEQLSVKGIEIEEVRKAHHHTHNISLSTHFKFKIEKEALIEKIKREEFL